MAPAQHPPWRLEIVERIGSTNDALIERAVAGEATRLALLARRQDAARGSRGRRWHEPPCGNLALSVLLRPDRLLWSPGTIVFAAALALSDALSGYVPDPFRLVLKWPNDVLLAGPGTTVGKIGGILVETGRHDGAGPDWAVIGMGVNLAAAPPVPGARALAEAATETPLADDVAKAILRELDRWLDVSETRGFAPIRAAWLRRAHDIGATLRVDRGGVERTGSFAGLDDTGALLFRTASGLERISTGVVLLGLPEPA